ncbi:MAG: tyrosine--tRNA ligase [bacterium]
MSKIITYKKKIEELLTRGVVDVIVKKDLEEKLKSGKMLRIKYGIDPTGPKIHLGRASTMRKLAKFQELGHQIVLIVGDFTAQIGDASDKTSERPMLSFKDVRENMKNYLSQIGKILDISKVEARYNSQWLGKLNYFDISKQADNFSAAELLDRENFSKRFKEGVRISLREMLYPLMQGYDSVAIKADVEIGGSDQLFNVLAGRTLQRAYSQEPQNIITFKLMDGTDGRKMSTSWGNIICIADHPNEIYGKIMSMKDELIVQYFELATDIPMSELMIIAEDLKSAKINPRDLKMRLAREIIKLYYDKKAALSAEENFKNIFQKKEIPNEMPFFKTARKKYTAIELLVEIKFASSKGEARRLIQQNGVKIDGNIIQNGDDAVNIGKEGVLIQKGKRYFVRVFN